MQLILKIMLNRYVYKLFLYFFLTNNLIINHLTLYKLKKIQIGVIGYNHNSLPSKTLDIAYDVGKEIAKKNAVLICGGLGGVMEYACKGAKDYGGLTVGIVPQNDPLKS